MIPFIGEPLHLRYKMRIRVPFGLDTHSARSNNGVRSHEAVAYLSSGRVGDSSMLHATLLVRSHPYVRETSHSFR